MLKQNRHKQILSVVRSKGSVEVHELCRLFNVAEMTIRRDLDELAAIGVLTRTHGGAVLPDDNILVERPFNVRSTQNVHQKEAIAHAALAMIQDGQKILLDSGTTTFTLARMIDNSRRLIVVTNAINIAEELNLRTNISVLTVGGTLRKNTLSCVGHFAEEMIRELTVDIAFLGVSGVSMEGNATSASGVEVGVKRAILASAKRSVVLADSSKIGRKEFALIAPLKDVDVLITDSRAPKSVVKKFRKMGTEVLIAKTS